MPTDVRRFVLFPPRSSLAFKTDRSMRVNAFKNFGSTEELDESERLYRERIAGMENAGDTDGGQ
jgi:hypothetical protein